MTNISLGEHRVSRYRKQPSDAAIQPELECPRVTLLVKEPKIDRAQRKFARSAKECLEEASKSESESQSPLFPSSNN